MRHGGLWVPRRCPPRTNIAGRCRSPVLRIERPRLHPKLLLPTPFASKQRRWTSSTPPTHEANAPPAASGGNSTPSSTSPVHLRPWSTPFAKTLAQAIEVTGPISIASYMRQCLTSPDGGYYTRPRLAPSHADQFGAAGDFTTSPEISQMFGELVAIWFMTEWMTQGRPKHGVQLIEMGPGRGTLMSDMLRTIGQFKTFAKAVDAVWLVEAGEDLRNKQKDVLCGPEVAMSEVRDATGKNVWWEAQSKQGTPVRWVEDVALLPRGVDGGGVDTMPFIIAHEFFDALPIHAFESVAPRQEGPEDDATRTSIGDAVELAPRRHMSSKLPQWRELLVAPATPKLMTAASSGGDAPDGGREPEPDFHLVVAKASTPSSLVIPERPRYRALKELVSSRVEISPESSRYVQDFARRIGKDTGHVPGTQTDQGTTDSGRPRPAKASGAALIIDYGPLDTVPINSLRAIRRHRVTSPFVYPGDADLSADVDFGALADAALEASAGVEVHGPVEQGVWLSQLGIRERARRLAAEMEQRSTDHDGQARRLKELDLGWQRLVDGGPKGMGKAYKVMAILPENGGRRRPVGFGGLVAG